MSRNEKTNIEIINNICEIVNNNLKLNYDCKFLINYVDDRLGHDFRYALNPRLIEKTTGWSPKYKFLQSITETINWYFNNKCWWKNLIS